MSRIREDIEELTTQILIDNDLMYKAPIDIVFLANKYGIKSYGIEIKNEISGAIKYYKEEDKFEILVNINNSENRRRFTIAHELGHYFLHQKMLKNTDMYIDTLNRTVTKTDRRTKEMEKEVDYFAGALLMNRELLKEISRRYEIEELAKIFEVSTYAMLVRMETLQLV